MADKVKCTQCGKLYIDAAALSTHRRDDHPILRENIELFRAAEDRLLEFLESDGSSKNLRELASKAAIVYNAESRREASRNNALTAVLMAARLITSDKEEIRRIVRTALPDHPISAGLQE